jgi:sporulation-control protein spo0M
MTAALLAAGCGGDEDQGSTQAGPSAATVHPSDMADHQGPPARLVVEVTIKGGNVTPTNEQLEAEVDQPIIFRVDSDVADELHVHSNPAHTFTIEAKGGQSFQFTVGVPGKVDVELHELKKTIATITVR